MCKCSFVLVACLAVASLASVASAQVYNPGDPSIGDEVAFNSKYLRFPCGVPHLVAG